MGDDVNKNQQNTDKETKRCSTADVPEGQKNMLKLQASLTSTCQPPPTLGTDDIQILSMGWTEELLKHKRKKIRLRPVGSDCEELCEAIKSSLPECTFVDEKGVLDVVVAKKTTRIEIDARSAITQLNIGPGDCKDVVMFIFHRVGGSITIEDVQFVDYSYDKVAKTLHIPYERKLVKPPVKDNVWKRMSKWFSKAIGKGTCQNGLRYVCMGSYCCHLIEKKCRSSHKEHVCQFILKSDKQSQR